jgi:YD repeat-containing protein
VNGGLVGTFDVYDAAGNLTDVWQPPVADALNGGTMTSPHTHYDYDASGEEIDEIDAKGNETTFAYDENGNQVKQTLPSPNGTTPGATESWTYDQYGRELTHTDFDGNVATYTYYTTYGGGAYAGSVEQVTYTPVGSMTPNETVTYQYDSLGRQDMITDVTSAGTRVDSHTYDPITGEVSSATTPEGTINYTYDPATGLLLRTWTNDGAEDETFGYDSQGRLQTVTVTKLDGQTVDDVTTYAYDNVGNLTSTTTTTGSGTIIATYTYDDLNRLTKLVNTDGDNHVLGSYTYTLDDQGNRTQVVEVDSSGNTRTVNYKYDNDDRLTEEKITVGSTITTDSYSYDLDGNRIGKVHTTSAGTETTTDTYNGDDELTQSVDSVSGTTTFTYDANGSQLTSTNGSNVTTDTYDLRNRLSSVTTGGVTTTYGYDDAGNRVSETTNGVTTYYLIDSNNPTGYAKPIEVKVGSPTAAPSTSYILGLGVIGQANSSGAVSYLLVDGQDNTRALVNSSGVVTATFNYDAFGDVLGATYTAANPPPTMYLFQQTMFDAASGMNIFGDGQREEQVGSPNFIEADSPTYAILSEPLTLNPRLLEDADPENGWDPSGHDDLVEIEVASFIDASIESANAVSTVALGTEEGAGAAYLAEDYTEFLEAEEATIDESLTPAEEANLDSEASSLSENAAAGNQFQDQALEAKGLPENTTTYTETLGNREISTIPDSYEEGVQMTEVKNVNYQYNSSQLQAQMQLAKSTNTPYTLIVRGGEQATKLSRPLIEALKAIRATVQEFDPVTKVFTPRIL